MRDKTRENRQFGALRLTQSRSRNSANRCTTTGQGGVSPEAKLTALHLMLCAQSPACASGGNTDDFVNALSLALGQNVPQVFECLDRQKPLFGATYMTTGFPRRDRFTTFLIVPLLFPSQSIRPYSAASAITRSTRE